MFKKIFAAGALALGMTCVAAPQADAGIFYRPAPVRRVVTRAALPPYPVARRVVARPVVTPVYGPVYRPVVYPAPVVYGPGVSVSVGW